MGTRKHSAFRNACLVVGLTLLLLTGAVWAETATPPMVGVDTRVPPEKAGASATMTLRGTGDGAIEVLDSEGRVQEVHSPGSLFVSTPGPDAFVRIQARRDEEMERVEEERAARDEKREAAAQAAAEAQQKRAEAAAARKAADEKAAREAAAVSLLDRRTGQYVKAVPVRPSAGQAAGQGNTLRLWDRRKHKYVLAEPLPEEN